MGEKDMPILSKVAQERPIVQQVAQEMPIHSKVADKSSTGRVSGVLAKVKNLLN